MTEHMLDIGSERRIGVDVLAKLARADAELHGKAEDVYKLVTGVSDEMRSENMVAIAIFEPPIWKLESQWRSGPT